MSGVQREQDDIAFELHEFKMLKRYPIRNVFLHDEDDEDYEESTIAVFIVTADEILIGPKTRIIFINEEE